VPTLLFNLVEVKETVSPNERIQIFAHTMAYEADYYEYDGDDLVYNRESEDLRGYWWRDRLGTLRRPADSACI
jgi:hypothetical protein